MKNNKSASLFEKEQVLTSLKQSFVKLNPRIMVKNPIMFTVEVCTAIMFLVMIYSIFDNAQGSFVYNAWVFVILFITLLFANFAEAIAEARGKAQADSLRKTREETPAKLLVNGQIKTTSSSQLKKGDVFICEAGDTIPADGEIINGLASIDESAITGESAPVIREAGGDKSSVTGGTKVLSDRIEVLVTQQPGESFLDKMIALVEGASRQKTPNEIALTILLAGFTLVFLIVCVTLKPFADYTGTVITIASFLSLFVCLIPTTIGGLLSAIGIAGMDRALRANVITKSGKAVETAGDIDTLLLDKTGTITEGKPVITDVLIDKNKFSEEEFLKITASVEQHSEHPLGESVVEEVKKRGISLEEVKNFTSISGEGIIGETGNRKVIVGNYKIFKNNGIIIPENNESTRVAQEGKTPIFVGIDGEYAGLIAVADVIKENSKESVAALKAMGLKVAMITGDNRKTAEVVAGQVGIDVVLAEVSPEDKYLEVKRLQNEGLRVGMVGDGINDSPALSQADVGIAIGGGTDIAMESADIILMRKDLNDVAVAMKLSHAVIKNIKENLFWAFLYNSLGIPVAAGVLFLITGHLLNPMIAGGAMAMSSVSVVTNALRLRNFGK